MATSAPAYPELGELCFCGLNSVLRQCTKGKPENTGRYFYTCPKNKDQDPCKYFAWADAKKAPARETLTSDFRAKPNFAARDFPQPPAPKKLKRSHAVADLSTCMNPAQQPEPTTPTLSSSQKGLLKEWDSRMAMISSANAQMLTKAIDQNNLNLEAMKRMMELMLGTMNVMIKKMDAKGGSDSGGDDESGSDDSDESVALHRDNNLPPTQHVVNPSCQTK